MLWWLLMIYLSFVFTVTAVTLVLVLKHLRMPALSLTGLTEPAADIADDATLRQSLAPN